MSRRVSAVLLGVAVATSLAVWFGSAAHSSPGRPDLTLAAMPLPTSTSTSTSTSTTTDGGGSTTTVPVRVPTRASPLRVLVIGDSLGVDLGESFVRDFDPTGIVATTIAARGDTGLANQAYFDWPARLPLMLAEAQPDFVVVLVGANDDQGMYVRNVPVSPASPAWSRAYAQRVERLLAESHRAGARVVWVGLPPMEDPDLNAATRRVNRIGEIETRRHPDALYLPPPSALVSCAGQYKQFAADASGNAVQLRTPDHVHLTWPGAQVLADGVVAAIDHRWHLALGPLTRPVVSSSPCPAPPSSYGRDQRSEDQARSRTQTLSIPSG